MRRIRYAEAKDMPALCELERLCFSEPWTEAMLEAERSSPDAALLVAETEEGVCGCAAFHRAGDQAELYRIAVRPEDRRRGYAADLLQVGESAAEGWGCTGLFLEVRRSNRPAAAVYESRGWHAIGIRNKYYVNPTEDAVLYAKELKP